jgi:hypothetical protein
MIIVGGPSSNHFTEAIKLDIDVYGEGGIEDEDSDEDEVSRNIRERQPVPERAFRKVAECPCSDIRFLGIGKSERRSKHGQSNPKAVHPQPLWPETALDLFTGGPKDEYCCMSCNHENGEVRSLSPHSKQKSASLTEVRGTLHRASGEDNNGENEVPQSLEHIAENEEEDEVMAKTSSHKCEPINGRKRCEQTDRSGSHPDYQDSMVPGVWECSQWRGRP